MKDFIFVFVICFISCTVGTMLFFNAFYNGWGLIALVSFILAIPITFLIKHEIRIEELEEKIKKLINEEEN